jgi:bifunctional UDP-N-acetylglucosamine pyrophosphorylase/glucosamine-1-phosphate N-acetyltransferase
MLVPTGSFGIDATHMSGQAFIVLAAGKGTRMKSAIPKVMHRAAGRSLLAHVLQAAREAGPERIILVTGPGMAEVAAEARTTFADAVVVEQKERLGTGHAVRMALPALAGFSGTVTVLFGDVPLITAATLKRLAGLVSTATPLALLGFEAADPHGYGRLVANPEGKVIRIVEELDATVEERRINTCNSGIISADVALLREFVPAIGTANAKGEFYLTDIVELAAKGGRVCALATCSEAEVAGVNDRVQLAAIEAALQEQLRRRHMLAGATLVAPETVYFSTDTVLGEDVLIEPHVVFGPGVRIADRVTVHAFSHLEGASIASGARIGPFARLRPGAEIGAEAHIGNFVEVKKASIGEGAKANHLSYIGDARVGERTNIGAGTITCNYDGFEKHLTDIGAEVFVGSNTALVAPVKIGDGASIAAGSVITREVAADALAIARPPLEVKSGWAARFRAMRRAQKAARQKR